MARKKDDVYGQIVAVTQDYFGPAAQRYIDRLLRNHLHKSPEEITRKDITKIVRWVKLTLALLTEDQVAVEEFSDRLAKLHHNK